MRQNTEAHCDALARLPISERIESLNVSNAAAIALYAARWRRLVLRRDRDAQAVQLGA